MAAKPEPNAPPVIGCDVARFGSDYTSIVVRKGDCVTHHETHNGWSTDDTAARLKELCRIHADGVEPRSVEVHVDADGIGAGVLDQAEGFRFIGARGSSRANSPDAYPNRRSEAWFSLAERARDGRLDLSRLSPESRSLLRRQAMAPEWKVDSQGRRVVEPKADTKRRLGRSPDDMDALNLAFTSAPEIEILWLGGTPGSSSEVHVDGEHESDYTDWLCPYCGGDPQGMRAVARYRPCAVDEAPGRPVHCAICYERCPSVRGAHNVTGWWRRSED